MRNETHPHGGFRSARAAALAARQWGNVTAAQLRRLGFTHREIEGMAQRGLLHRMHRGVYAFGAPSPAPEATWAAALLAAGRGAALSQTSAAALYGMLPPLTVTEVTAPTKRRGDATLRVHRAKAKESHRRRGLMVTTVPQTLLDLAATGHAIDRLTHEAAASGLISLDALTAFAQRKRGAPGARALRNALALPHTRSRWERRFLAWLHSLDALPRPAPNDPIGRMTVDLHWPEHGLVVELDTRETHGAAWARRRDAARDRCLRERGLTVLRINQETFDPADVERRLRGRADAATM
jgi:very-short-patch-repair endonuclease